MADRRQRNVQWVATDENGKLYDSIKDGAQFAVLLDIRDELTRLNELLYCQSFTSIPATLKRIARNTAKPRKKARRG